MDIITNINEINEYYEKLGKNLQIGLTKKNLIKELQKKSPELSNKLKNMSLAEILSPQKFETKDQINAKTDKKIICIIWNTASWKWILWDRLKNELKASYVDTWKIYRVITYFYTKNIMQENWWYDKLVNFLEEYIKIENDKFTIYPYIEQIIYSDSKLINQISKYSNNLNIRKIVNNFIIKKLEEFDKESLIIDSREYWIYITFENFKNERLPLLQLRINPETAYQRNNQRALNQNILSKIPKIEEFLTKDIADIHREVYPFRYNEFNPIINTNNDQKNIFEMCMDQIKS